MPSLDRGTKIYALVLMTLVAGLVFLALYESPVVSKLNDKLQADPQIAGFPYPFKVLRVSNGVAEMSTPRSSVVPVSQVLGKIFPDLGNAAPSSSRFQAFQSQLASTQKRAKAIVMKDPEIKRIQWKLDRDWLSSHGVVLPPSL